MQRLLHGHLDAEALHRLSMQLAPNSLGQPWMLENFHTLMQQSGLSALHC